MSSDQGVEMSITKNAERKRPSVRKSKLITDSGAKIPSRKLVENKTTFPFDVLTLWKNHLGVRTAILMILTALISSGITFVITNGTVAGTSTESSTEIFSDITAGKVALTEPELVDAVNKLNIDIYWAGPVKDAKYTLAVPVDGQAYVRYLPKGQGLGDTKPNYLVIATYATANAFDSTQAAGNQSDGITYINTEGAAIYYDKKVTTNVYVAYPDTNYQIEIFHPVAAKALEIANKSGVLVLIK